MFYSYSPRTGGLARDPVRPSTGSAQSGLNSPHLAAALAQIDRAFGASKVTGGKA
jgi:hypothetical protein